MDNLQLIKEYGSPLYVFHDAEFIENYEHLCRAMREYYPNYNPGYSYKTNYTPHICKLVGAPLPASNLYHTPGLGRAAYFNWRAQR